MDDTTKLIVEKALTPILSGALGFAGAAFRFYLHVRDLDADVKTFKKSLKSFTTSQIAHGTQLADIVRRLEIVERLELAQALKDHEDALSSLSAGMRLEIQSHRHDLEELIAEVRSSIRSVEDSSHDFAKEAALAQFMSQQATRWEQIQRTLGRIEGLMERGK